MTTKKGEPINAVYGLVSMLLKIIQDLKPTHIIICFDRKEPTFRHKELATYQAQRPPTDKALSSQFEKAKEVTAAFGIPVFEKAGYEADDLIGTLATQATEISNDRFPISYENKKSKIVNLKSYVDEVIIVTGDRDQFQLINDKVKIYMPVTGLSNAKMMGEEGVLEKMGVKPSQIADYKALVGDASDNYFGVPGIGPKTAINLLKEFENVEEIFEWLDKVVDGKMESPRAQKAQRSLKEHGISIQVAEKLLKGRSSALQSKRLAQIVIDVEIKLDLDKAKKWRVDSDRVLDLFAAYGFKTLTKRIREVGKQIVSENQGNLF